MDDDVAEGGGGDADFVVEEMDDVAFCRLESEVVELDAEDRGKESRTSSMEILRRAYGASSRGSGIRGMVGLREVDSERLRAPPSCQSSTFLTLQSDRVPPCPHASSNSLSFQTIRLLTCLQHPLPSLVHHFHDCPLACGSGFWSRELHKGLASSSVDAADRTSPRRRDFDVRLGVESMRKLGEMEEGEVRVLRGGGAHLSLRSLLSGIRGG